MSKCLEGLTLEYAFYYNLCMKPQLPLSIPQEELVNFNKFWQSLSDADQEAMNELIVAAAHNQAAIKYSGYDLPYYLFLISLLIEYHKELGRLRRLLEEAMERRAFED